MIFRKFYPDCGPPTERAIKNGDLNSLVESAFVGAEGPLEKLAIRTNNGLRFDAGEIAALALRGDRPPIRR